MKKFLSISSIALCGLLWAQQSLDITSSTGIKSFLVSEIVSIVPGVKTTTFKLVGGSTYRAPTAGQKWIFSSPSSSSISSSSATLSSSSDQTTASITTPNLIQWKQQDGQIFVNSTHPTQFQLLSLGGQQLGASPSASFSWQFTTPIGVYILRTHDNSSVKNYLVQIRESK